MVLVIVGGLNWGLYVFGQYLVRSRLGWISILEKGLCLNSHGM
ncbi:MAG TPA: hypothetical protein HA349_10915 [Methanotrichaceae archaeon]|nr:hypothetical protein [Methanotrichaceae archaeon]